MAVVSTVPRLAELEVVIERGLATFVEVGQALLEIRGERLYRESHGTFEDYCRERWGFSRPQAYRMIQSAEVADALSPIGDTPAPVTESVARELAPLRDKPEAMRAAWVEAVERSEQPTAAEVREIVQTRGQLANQAGGTDEWATPQDFFDAVNAEFRFDLDVCALDSSAKCARYFTPADDGLSQEWTGTVWMNPPYGDEIVKWVQRAHESARNGTVVVCLVPSRTDTGWWWDYCIQGEVRFLRGRLKFGGSGNSAPFPSALVVFGYPAAVRWWEWR